MTEIENIEDNVKKKKKKKIMAPTILENRKDKKASNPA